VRHGLLSAVLVIAACLVASRDVASAPTRTAVLRGSMVSQQSGASVGAPNAGALVDGEHLDENDRIRVVPAFAGRDTRWGLPSLVRGLDRAARAVARRFPDAMLSVGDMSRRRGGEVGQHKSHQSGRDADVAFYMTDRDGSPLYHQRMVPFRGDGSSPMLPAARFDDARNWSLIEALLSDPEVHLQKVFVAGPLRQRLLHEAERRGVPLALRLRAAEVLVQPRTGSVHDDHFHIRVGCPPGQERVCEIAPRKPMRTAPASNTNARQRSGSPAKARN